MLDLVDILLLGGMVFIINLVVSPMLNGLLCGIDPVIKIGTIANKKSIYKLEKEDGLYYVKKEEFRYIALPYIKTGYLLIPASVLFKKKTYISHHFSPDPLTEKDLLTIDKNPEHFPYSSLSEYWEIKYHEYRSVEEELKRKRETKEETLKRVKESLESLT